MKAIALLRTASVLSFVHCALHTIGGVLSAPRHGREEIEVIDMMKTHRFDTFGSMRSYWDFHFGYGLFVTTALLVQAILFWQLAGSVKSSPTVVRPIVALFGTSFLVTAFISLKYFFLGPAVTELLIAMFLMMAFLTAGTAAKVGIRILP